MKAAKKQQIQKLAMALDSQLRKPTTNAKMKSIKFENTFFERTLEIDTQIPEYRDMSNKRERKLPEVRSTNASQNIDYKAIDYKLQKEKKILKVIDGLKTIPIKFKNRYESDVKKHLDTIK